MTTSLALMTSLLSFLASELDDFDVLAGWDDFSVQVFDTFAEVDDFDNFLAHELDDFDDLAGWDDFTVQVFDKFAKVDDFDNLADFDEFTVQVELANFDG